MARSRDEERDGGTTRNPSKEKQLLLLSRSQGTGQPSNNNETGPVIRQGEEAPGERYVCVAQTPTKRTSCSELYFFLWEVMSLLVLM